MTAILAENLSGKAVMGSDGARVGMLYNITMDLKTGELDDLVVDPGEETPTRELDFSMDDQGRYLVPINHVQAVKDHIVIRR